MYVCVCVCTLFSKSILCIDIQYWSCFTQVKSKCKLKTVRNRANTCACIIFYNYIFIIPYFFITLRIFVSLFVTIDLRAAEIALAKVEKRKQTSSIREIYLFLFIIILMLHKRIIRQLAQFKTQRSAISTILRQKRNIYTYCRTCCEQCLEFREFSRLLKFLAIAQVSSPNPNTFSLLYIYYAQLVDALVI